MTAGSRAFADGKRHACVALAAAVVAAQVGAASGQNLRTGAPNFPTLSTGSFGQRGDDRRGRAHMITPSVSGLMLYTDNVDLEPDDRKKGDWVLELTPALTVDVATPRAVVKGSVAVPIRAYANSDAESVVSPVGSLYGRGEVVEDWFFVEGEARFQQSYLSPFGAQSDNAVNNNANRFSSYTYRVSPYIEDVIGSTLRYQVRNDNIWSNVNDSSLENRQFYTNRLIGSVDRLPTPIGWGVDYLRSQYEVERQSRNQTTELARARLVYRPDPELQLQLSVGYERNKFLFSESEGGTYGAGLEWRPTSRTRVSGVYEHRFFGPSYSFEADHRTPLTVWNLRASRYITTYPEEIATLATGGDVVSLLDSLLTSRIPEAAERQRFVSDYVTEHGLPLVLTEPLPIVSERIYLRESASATAGLVGARNGLFASIYRSKVEPIAASGLAFPSIFDQTQNTQVGVDLRWTYSLLANHAFTATTGRSQTKSNSGDGLKADRWWLNATLTRRMTPRTSTFVSARYRALDSLPELSYREKAVLAGFNYSFR